MAIFHLSVKTVSRSAGRSATAAAAYRAGVEIADERTGEIHDYTRKGGVESAVLVLPDGAPEWAADRAALWNAAEQAETRKNSTVAREFEIALPSELSPDERQRLAHDLAREIVGRHGCAADVAIHAPGKEGDNRNHHAHILCSTRRLTPEGFSEKTRELDDLKTGEVKRWRERFASLQNERLRENGIDARVDHRTLEAQGIEREPTRHLGPSATGFERRTGEPSRKRLDFEQDAAERLARAKAQGDLERQGKALDREITVVERNVIDLSGDVRTALKFRDDLQQIAAMRISIDAIAAQDRAREQAESERQRQAKPAPEVAQAAASGVADFRAQFEAAKQVEAGKQQARQAFEKFKAEQQAQQRQAELAKQQAAQVLAKQREEAERKQQAEQARQQPKRGRDNGPDFSM